ncbi:lytic transglycosylase domain-containing protein [Thermodesulforhabdus norvegica]|uniref:Transglycosylase SLT domain-containing protein n=1 Tax=Thermodesulforhabdus norvegica TaxID=39841 RepID=A0A1I4V6M4_9BACT|nr:lytic transglycosylase domain-containing protein [Thermodesulforhabdus norvegica]SFM96803.1 Transglycosylase SLT domain-containing protein [Thermodesulforhabdus norvegica]
MRYFKWFIGVSVVILVAVGCGFAFEGDGSVRVKPGERVLLSPLLSTAFENAIFVSSNDRLDGPDLRSLFHPSVDYWVERFSRGRWRYSLEEALRNLWIYEGTMRRIFRRAGVPEELIFLCLVESHGRILSLSPHGAAGLWQIMPSTARYLGLRVNNVVDERYDPVKSTWAVARYLKKLYEKFGRWDLVFAAYNYGEYGVEEKIRRYGVKDFFRLVELRCFPRETRTYVPKVFATIRMGRSLLYAQYMDKERLTVRAVEVLRVTRPVSLMELSEILGMPLSVLMRLNPAVRNPYVNLPGGFLLHVPIGLRDLAVRALWGSRVM